MNSLTTTLFISHGKTGAERTDTFFAHNIIIGRSVLYLEFYYPSQTLEKILKKKNLEFMADVLLEKRQFWLALELDNYMQTVEKEVVFKYKLTFKIPEDDITYLEIYKFYQKNKLKKNLQKYLVPLLIPIGFGLGFLLKENSQYKVKIDSGFKKMRQIESTLRKSFEEKWKAEAKVFKNKKEKYIEQIEKLESGLRKLGLELIDLEEEKTKELKGLEEKITKQEKNFDNQKKDLKEQISRKNSLNQLIAHLQERLFYFSVTATKENILINGPSDRSILGDPNYHAGKRMMGQKKYKAATGYFLKVVKDHPGSRWSYSALSRAYYKTGQIKKARKEFYGFLRILKTDFIRKSKQKK